MIEPVQILDVGSAHVTGTWRDVAFIVWRDAIPALLVVEQVNHIMEWGGRLDGRFGVVVVVEPNTPLPGPMARVELGNGIQRLAPRLRAAALLLEGEGFWVAAARAVVLGLNVANHKTHAETVVSTVGQAADFVIENMGYDPDTMDRFVEVVRHLRALPAPSVGSRGPAGSRPPGAAGPMAGGLASVEQKNGAGAGE